MAASRASLTLRTVCSSLCRVVVSCASCSPWGVPWFRDCAFFGGGCGFGFEGDDHRSSSTPSDWSEVCCLSSEAIVKSLARCY